MIIEKVKELAKERLPEQFLENHIKLVVKEALELCKYYPNADKEIVQISAWLHDIVHLVTGYKGDHSKPSAETAKEFLEKNNYPKEKIREVYHCIRAHRTSSPPEPKTIEAKIVASADNLTHFTNFDFLVNVGGLKWASKKIKRDLSATFMLPEAIEKANRLLIIIKKKYKI